MARKLAEYIRCALCGTPVAEWQGDSLIIIDRHHGEKHTTVIPTLGRRAPLWNQSANTDAMLATDCSSEAPIALVGQSDANVAAANKKTHG